MLFTTGAVGALRVASKNRKMFEPGIKRKLHDLNHSLDNYFETQNDEFLHVVTKKRKIESRSFVLCNDVNKLCKIVVQNRGYYEVMPKIGIDGGGGFLKITLTVQNIHELREKYGRQTYSEGVATKSFKDAGVKKLFLLGVVPSTQENYENVSKLWLLLRISTLKGVVATDLKLANILAGLMTHSSSYPCTWCTAFHGKLDVCGEYRTIGSCLKNYSDWLNADGLKKNSKNFKNCINPPLFEGDHDEQIIEFIPPPELHLMLGVVNKLYDHMLLEFEEDSIKWAKLCNVERKTTHGVAFAGNACKTLLNKVDVLRSFCNIGCLKYVRCFQDFQVVDTCFSITLKENFEINIQKFRASYLDLKISVTPKVHAVFFHVSHFCNLTNKGLGLYSEQAVESAHHDFNITWQKYKVSNEHPQYAARLLRAVCEYNSQHI